MFSKNLFLLAVLLQGAQLCASLKAMPDSYEPAIAQFQASASVNITNSEVILYGKQDEYYTWLSFPIASIPFDKFRLEVEAAAEPVDGKLPNIGIAYSSTPQNFLVEKTVNTVEWQQINLGEFTKTSDNRIYFIFTNDYYNPETGADLNLRIRKITFQGEQNILFFNTDSVKLSWDANIEEDLAGYKIYYGYESGYYTNQASLATTITSFLLALEMDNIYFAAVTAYDTAGNESAYSQEVVFQRVTPKDSTQVVFECDINGDGQLTNRDWFQFNRSMNSQSGDSNYLHRADLNSDGKINELDENLLQENCEARLSLNSLQ